MAYQAQPQMVVAQGGGGNRNSKNLPIVDGQREWSNGLFSCCEEAGTCITACFCPCIVYSRVKNRYDHLATTGTADPSGGGELFHSNCIIHCAVTACFGVGWLFQFLHREKVRGRYAIRGSAVGDCLTACCCSPCELTQEMREIELEEQSLGHQKQ